MPYHKRSFQDHMGKKKKKRRRGYSIVKTSSHLKRLISISRRISVLSVWGPKAYLSCISHKEMPRRTLLMLLTSCPIEMNLEDTQLCNAWGRVRDQRDFILFDTISTHNLILVELAQKLGIRTKSWDQILMHLEPSKGNKSQLHY